MAIDEIKPVIKEDADFINQHIKPESTKDGVITMVMGKIDYRKFMKRKGVSQDTIKQISDANNDLLNSSILIAKDKLLESEKDIDGIRIKMFTDFGKYETRLNRKIHNRKNPKTNESIKKYGGCDIVVKVKPLLDKDLIETCLSDIEANINNQI